MNIDAQMAADGSFVRSRLGPVSEIRSSTPPATIIHLTAKHGLRLDFRRSELCRRGFSYWDRQAIRAVRRGSDAAAEPGAGFAEQQDSGPAQLRQSGNLHLQQQADFDITPKLKLIGKPEFVVVRTAAGIANSSCFKAFARFIGTDLGLGLEYPAALEQQHHHAGRRAGIDTRPRFRDLYNPIVGNVPLDGSPEFWIFDG